VNQPEAKNTEKPKPTSSSSSFWMHYFSILQSTILKLHIYRRWWWYYFLARFKSQRFSLPTSNPLTANKLHVQILEKYVCIFCSLFLARFGFWEACYYRSYSSCIIHLPQDFSLLSLGFLYFPFFGIVCLLLFPHNVFITGSFNRGAFDFWDITFAFLLHVVNKTVLDSSENSLENSQPN